MADSDPVLAAGAVCWKITAKGKLKILVVHRTQHQDVSLPKGKLEPGETLPETAVREIAEETGLVVALGTPLGIVEYPLPGGRPKSVYYWAAETDRLSRANSTFVSNDEIEQLTWLTIPKARAALTYPHDVDIVDRFAELAAQGRARTFAIIALRHGKAIRPESWDGPDATRPLIQRGIDQSTSIAPGIAAYRPGHLVSSTAERCLATITSVARLTGVDVIAIDTLSQEAFESSGKQVSLEVERRLAAGISTVFCSHGPVLPQIIATVARATGSDDNADLRRAAQLSTGQYVVLHVPTDDPTSGIVAVEIHGPTV